jgi:hypothetical protein
MAGAPLGGVMERREAPRYKVVLPAVCVGEGRGEFYAVTDNVSTGGILFTSATRPRLDETLTCRIRHIGTVETRVTRLEEASFVARVLTRRPTVDIIARSLLDISKRQVDLDAPTRAHPRIVPRRRDVTITFDGGASATGALLDVSASGAGLLVDPVPELGAFLRVGATPARVVRVFEGGVGVIFVRPFETEYVTDQFVP